MFETIITILIIWFVISIPVSLIVGRFLALSNNSENDQEDTDHGDRSEFRRYARTLARS